MDKLVKLIEKLATSKRIVVLIILAMLAFFVYKNLDFITEVTFKIDRQKSDKETKKDSGKGEKEKLKKTGHAEIEIKNVQLSPIDFELPNYFYFELHNSGSIAAENIQLTVDLGKANLSQYEIRSPSNHKIVSGGSNTNIIKVVFDSINSDESIYIYTLLTIPIFKKVVITSDNIPSTLSYTIEDFKGAENPTNFFSGGLITFLRIVIGGVILVFIIYAVVVIIMKLNRVFKIESEETPKEQKGS